MEFKYAEGQTVRIVVDPVGQYNGFLATVMSCEERFETDEPLAARPVGETAAWYLVSVTAPPKGETRAVPRLHLHLAESALEAAAA